MPRSRLGAMPLLVSTPQDLIRRIVLTLAGLPVSVNPLLRLDSQLPQALRATKAGLFSRGTGSVEWEWLPILKQSFIQTPVQFSRDPYVVEIPGRMGICMPYVIYPINSSRVFVRELFYIQIA